MRIKSFGQSTFAAFCAGAVRSAVVRHETGAQPGSRRTPVTGYSQSISQSLCNLAARVPAALQLQLTRTIFRRACRRSIYFKLHPHFHGDDTTNHLNSSSSSSSSTSTARHKTAHITRNVRVSLLHTRQGCDGEWSCCHSVVAAWVTC